MRKFLSNSVEGTVISDAAGVPEAFGIGAGETPVVVVVMAGDMAVAGVIPGTAGETPVTGETPVIGETPVVAGGMAGLIAGAAGVVTAAGLIVVGGGDVWPNEVSARVTEQRLAISSFFIGLVGKFSRARIPMSWISSSMR
jgi:hypothetical protein